LPGDNGLQGGRRLARQQATTVRPSVSNARASSKSPGVSEHD